MTILAKKGDGTVFVERRNGRCARMTYDLERHDMPVRQRHLLHREMNYDATVDIAYRTHS